MKIVGSRTGAYEFHIQMPDGQKFWMGQKKYSDLDILLEEDEPEPVINANVIILDIFRGRPFGPYIEKGRLYLTNNYNYLLYPLSFMAITVDQIRNFLKPVVCDLQDKNQKKVGELFTDFSLLPESGNFFARELVVRQKAFAKISASLRPSP
jgi:hypothetical protein